VSAIAKEPQMQLMGEQVIHDPDLESLLIECETQKATVGEYRKIFSKTDEAARTKINALGITGRARCGEFVITVSETPAKSVSFETQPTTRIRISRPKDDDRPRGPAPEASGDRPRRRRMRRGALA